MKQRPTDQMLPIAGKQDVLPAVIHDIETQGMVAGHSKSHIQSLTDLFTRRIALGVERYGQPLQTHNGRDSLLDALEEALDLTNYLKQHHLETQDHRIQNLYWRALGIVSDLVEWRESQT